MAIRRIFDFVRTKHTFLLHSIVVATLIGVSVWDSSLIISTFMNDNKMTVVRTDTANGSAIFLENLTIGMVYQDSVFPKAWLHRFNMTRLREFDHSVLDTGEATTGELDIRSVNASSTEGLIATAVLLTALSALDDAGFRCLLNGRKSCESDAYLQNYIKILLNKPELEHLEETLFANLSDSMTPRSTVPDEPAGHDLYTIHRIRDFSTLRAEINPAAVVKQSNGFAYLLRLIDDSPDFQWDNASSFYSGMGVYDKRTMIAQFQFEPKHKYDIYMTVKNSGIYDKSITTDCSWEPEFSSDNVGSLYNARNYLRMIAKKCACIPFTEKRNFRKFRDSSWMSLPYCDFRKYYECSEEAGPVEFDETDWLPSCVLVRNQYDPSVIQSVCDQEICPYVAFIILVTDHTYVIYEDRFQLTTTQFISQIGGDIGLYTGLSLLSLWQLIVFLHNRHGRYKMKYFSMSPDGRRDFKYYKGFVIEVIKEIESFSAQTVQRKVDETPTDGGHIDRGRAETRTHWNAKSAITPECSDMMERRINKIERQMEARFVSVESKLAELLAIVRNASNKTVFISGGPNDCDMHMVEV